MNLKLIAESYSRRVKELHTIYKMNGARACANASGKVFEGLVDDIVGQLTHLQSLQNDYLTVKCGEFHITNVQVDRHIRRVSDNTLCAVIECKTYLDACFLKRAVIDFAEIVRSSNAPETLSLAIVTGQMCIAEDTYQFYQAFCRELMGKEIHIFVVNTHKKRNSKRPLYKVQFDIDMIEIQRLYDYLTSV